MSYVVSYYPPAIQSFLEQRPLLADLLDTVAVYLLMLGATGVLIWWRTKYYRPKPPRIKVAHEAKPLPHKRRKLGLVGKFLLTCFLVVLLAQLVFFIGVAAMMAIQAAGIPLGNMEWKAYGIVIGFFLICLLVVWLAGR